MRIIYKYKLKITDDVQELILPLDAKFLYAYCQIPKEISLWFEVNTTSLVKRFFHVFGTGQNIYESFNLIHLATVIDTPFVWHIFEEV